MGGEFYIVYSLILTSIDDKMGSNTYLYKKDGLKLIVVGSGVCQAQFILHYNIYLIVDINVEKKTSS